MSDKHWEMFFDLLERIVDLEGLSAREKADKVREEASRHGQEVNLEEFLAQMS